MHRTIRKDVRAKAKLSGRGVGALYNLTVRHFNKRFARLGLGWSRKLDNHKAAISLFVAVFNFCKVHNTLGTTPAHGAGITDGPWTIERLIDEVTQY
jgi:hypothetical protein